MTCIIAHRDGWMAADQMTSFGPERAPIVVSKVINLGYALLAAAGDSGFRQLAAKALKGKTERTLAEAVSKHIRDTKPEIDVLVLTKRDLVWVNEKGVVFTLKPEQRWWAIGSGRDSAKGYLACWEKLNPGKHMPSGVAFNAIAYTASIDAQVGHGVQLEHL